MRSNSKIEFYRNIFTHCFIPECKNTIAEIHHIVPISKDGKHIFVNFIGLCYEHHRRRKLHKNWYIKQTELFFYKFNKELEILGFTSDISEKEFKHRIRYLRKKLELRTEDSIENSKVHSCGEFLPRILFDDNLGSGGIIKKKPFQAIPLKTYICINCGKEFKDFYIDSHNDRIIIACLQRRKYCSYKCNVEYKLNHPSEKRKKRHCVICGKLFYEISSIGRKTCSHYCSQILKNRMWGRNEKG